MKICIVALNIVPYFRPQDKQIYGGADVQAGFLARALADAGEDVSLVVTDLPPGERLPFRAYNAYQQSGGISGFRFFHPRLLGLRRALQEADADVYYQRNASMVTGITALYCRQNGTVFVYGAGSDSDFLFSKLIMSGVTALRDKMLYYVGLKRAHGIVVQNELQRELCSKKIGKPARFIPNGVNLGEQGEIEDRELVLWVGAVRSVKRPGLFLELARRLPRERFLLAGGYSEPHKDFAHKIMDSAESVPNLTLAGHTPHHELMDYMRRTLVLVNTSHFEGFPNAFLEAWSQGVPVITMNDVDGIIAREKVGWVCRDVGEMADLIRTLRSEPDQALAAGKRAKALVATRYSAPVIAKQYVAFFRELLNRQQHHDGVS